MPTTDNSKRATLTRLITRKVHMHAKLANKDYLSMVTPVDRNVLTFYRRLRTITREGRSN